MKSGTWIRRAAGMAGALSLCIGAVATEALASGTTEYAVYGTQRQVDMPAAVGDPVSAASGAFSWQKTLIPLGGPMELDFTLHYRTDPNYAYVRDPGDFPPGYYYEDTAVPFLSVWSWQPAPLLGGNSWYDMTVLLDDGGQVCFTTNETGEFVFAEIPEISGGVSRNYQLKRMGNWFYFCDPVRGRVTMFNSPMGTTRFYRPETVLDRNSNRLSYAYTAPTYCNPRSIADEAGRALYFGYEWVEFGYEWIQRRRLSAVTDHVGRAWTFLYDTNAVDNGGRHSLRGVVEPGGRTNRFVYTPNNLYYGSGNISSQVCLLASAIRPCGNATFSNEYATSKLPDVDRHVRCTAQTDALGHRMDLVITTELGRCVGHVTNPDGSTNRFVHDGHHDLPPGQITDAAGATMQFGRNSIGHILSATDREGHVTRFGFDTTGRRLTSVTNAMGETTAIVWETVEQSFTNLATNHTVTFSFDQVVRIDYPDGTSESFAYDGQGNVTARTDRAGAVWTTVRDDRGRPVQSLRPGGGGVTRTYATNGLLLSSTDSDGAAESYGYDGLFRLTSVTNAGGVRHYAYDEAGRLERITDEIGGETVLAYDANGNPTNVVNPAGYVLSREYDAMDRLAAELDGAGPLETRTFDEMGRLAESTTPAATNVFGYHPNGWLTNAATGARAWAWRHDADGRLTNAVAPDGGITAIERDALGRPVAVTDPLGHATAIAYDAAGRIAGVTNPLGAATRYAYDGAGRLVAVTNSLGGVATREYDADGNLAAATNPDGRPTAWSYTPMGRLLAVSNALGEIVRLGYGADGRLAVVTNADGTATAWEYDAAGRVAAFTDEATNVWRFARDARGAVVAVTNPAGGATAYAYNPDGTLQTATDDETGLVSNRYDAARRLVETTLPDGSSAQWAYNEHGETIAFTDPSGATTHYAYDAAGRLASVTDALGQAAAYAYDAAGCLTNAADRTGAATSYEYDAAGRLIAATDPTGVRRTWTRDLLGHATNVAVGTSVWQIAYNASGVATQMVAPSGRVTAYVSDALGRIAQTVDPLRRTNAVAYDARGRIASAIDPAGRTTTYAYDPCGRLAGTTLPDGSGFVCSRDALGGLDELVDAGSNAWDFAWSPLGRPLGVTDPLARTTAYSNDVRGQVAGIAYPNGDQLNIERDANGRIIRANHSAGPDLQFQRDVLGRLTNANDLALAYDAEGRVMAVESADVAFGAAYDAAGRLATATYADGTFAVTYTYAVGPNGDGRLTRVSDSLTGTQVDFTYDADGRLATVALPNGETIVHTWDDAGRLTRLQSGDHVDAQRTYDLAGQVAQTVLTAPLPTSDGLAVATNELAFDAASQISTAGFAHDARGRVTQMPAPWHPGGAALAWDGASRLTNANGAAFAYDGLGNVQTRAESGATNRFCHHPAIGGAPIVAEQNAATGEFRRFYVWTPGGRLLYLIDAANGNAVRFYHFDPTGNTLALTDTNRVVTDAWAYAPYGRVLARTGSSPQPFTFCGVWGVRQDGDDGLYQMRARWYHARLARFLSPEPIWPQLHEPKALNSYQYAGADPIRFADPSGRSLLNIIHSFDPAIQEWYKNNSGWSALNDISIYDVQYDPEWLKDHPEEWSGKDQERSPPRTHPVLNRLTVWDPWSQVEDWENQSSPQLSTVPDVVAKNLASQIQALQNQQQSGAWFSPPPPDPVPPVAPTENKFLRELLSSANSSRFPIDSGYLPPAPAPVVAPTENKFLRELLSSVDSSRYNVTSGSLTPPTPQIDPAVLAKIEEIQGGGPLWKQAATLIQNAPVRNKTDLADKMEQHRKELEERIQERQEALQQYLESHDLTDEQKAWAELIVGGGSL